jgi:integrase
MAKPYGKKSTYQITPQAIEFLISSLETGRLERKSRELQSIDYSKLVRGWEVAMQNGNMTGKVFSPLTIDYYIKNIERIIAKHKGFNAKTVQIEFALTGRDEYAKRYKLYKAVVSFGKFMIRQGVLDDGFLQEVKPLQPIRHKPPKRITVNELDLQLVMGACESDQEKLIVVLLASTGIRASECCAIRFQDLDLELGTLNIPIGKGGKTRRLGLPAALLETVREFMSRQAVHHPAMALSLDSEGTPLDRYALYRILKRIGKRAGVPVHPHALRRSFVTINANKGRSLVILQRSCGHSDIKTTMSYCLTAEQEVIDAMKGW